MANVVCLADVRPATRPAPAAPPRRLTWAELVEREPALGQLERELRALKRQPRPADFCANEVWYGYRRWRGRGFRARVVGLVGWCAESAEPDLRTSAAYEVAYQKLYDLLPDCGDCLCG